MAAMAMRGGRQPASFFFWVACWVTLCPGLVGGNTKAATLRCEGDAKVARKIPRAMLFIERKLLWCPNAKAATTTVFGALFHAMREKGFTGLGSDRTPNIWGHLEGAWKLARSHPATAMSICSATSFMIVRNPWDRLISAYFGKIVSGKIKIRKGPPSKVTFANFIDYVARFPSGNRHWMPYNVRCPSAAFPFTEVLKLEDPEFMQKLEHLFSKAGLGGEIVYMNNNNNSHATSVEDKLAFRRKMFLGESGGLGWRLVNLVHKAYAADISGWHYSFNEFS